MNPYKILAILFILAITSITCDAIVSLIKGDVSAVITAIGVLAIAAFAIHKNKFVQEELLEIWRMIRK